VAVDERDVGVRDAELADRGETGEPATDDDDPCPLTGRRGAGRGSKGGDDDSSGVRAMGRRCPVDF